MGFELTTFTLATCMSTEANLNDPNHLANSPCDSRSTCAARSLPEPHLAEDPRTSADSALNSVIKAWTVMLSEAHRPWNADSAGADSNGLSFANVYWRGCDADDSGHQESERPQRLRPQAPLPRAKSARRPSRRRLVPFPERYGCFSSPLAKGGLRGVGRRHRSPPNPSL